MYKVFNQQRAIIFTENLTLLDFSNEDTLIEQIDLDDLFSVYQEFIDKNSEGNLIFLIKNKLQIFVDKFLSHFKKIDAAGGMIVNTNGELLLIHRFGKWDLPKGKIEKNEQIDSAAIRECNEETGVENVLIEKPLEVTFHIYIMGDKQILKKTYWFAMKTKSMKALIPQFEEGIEKVKWMNKAAVSLAIQDTYDSLKELIKNNYLNK